MAVRLDVVTTIEDARAGLRLKAFRESAGSTVTAVHVADSYLLDAALSHAGLSRARHALINPLMEAAHMTGAWVPKRFAYAIEVGFLPGVTDNVGATAQETIEDATGYAFKAGEKVYSSQVFVIEGALTEHDVHTIAASLYNPLIHSATIYDRASWKKRDRTFTVPRVSLSGSSEVAEVNLELADTELAELGKLGIADVDGTRRGPLALSLEYLKTIRNHYRALGRKPTDIELEALAQTWSEHCKHTIFASPLDSIEKGIYKTYIKGATEKIRAKKGKNDFCVSVFKDNSGGIVFDDEYVITHKAETHNSPSALDPFGGAVTGIVGVNRDAMGFGLGAKPVANTYGFCFASPEETRPLFRDSERTQEMLLPKRIMEGVIKGVNVGGNQSGIPTPNGFMIFDESYRGKPLVFVGTIGLIPKKRGKRVLYKKEAKPGDYIVMVGGRVGLDGVHGATFSSESINAGSPVTSVQIGDPITQKKFSDVIIKEARDQELYTSITDNGAGGLSSSVGEMAEQSGGCHVRLEKVPLKYPGLAPWQIWISESQERMTLAVPKKKWKAFHALMQRRGVEATVIGEFTESGKCIVTYGSKTIMDLSLEFLHDGLPVTPLKTTKPNFVFEEPDVRVPKDFSGTFAAMLARENIASNAFISRQYDHEVQSGSVLKPLQGKGQVNADAAVFRPRLESERGVVLSSGITPYYANIDPYGAAAASIDTAVRSAVAAGAPLDHLAILDNFCWCSSDEPERLWQLKEAAKACYDVAVAYGTPYISGKDSMFNDFKGYDEKGNPLKISVLPTLLISTIAVIKDAQKAVSLDAKMPGDLVYLLGETHEELGGSEYFRMISEHNQEGKIGMSAPQVDAKKNLRLYKALAKAIEQELVASSVSVTRGGVAVALARMGMAGMLGIDANLEKIPGSTKKSYALLFSESQGRIIVSIAPENATKFEKLFSGLPFKKIGTVTKGKSISIAVGKKNFANLPLGKALEAYRSTFKNY